MGWVVGTGQKRLCKWQASPSASYLRAARPWFRVMGRAIGATCDYAPEASCLACFEWALGLAPKRFLKRREK